jgi:hypothetical protein
MLSRKVDDLSHVLRPARGIAALPGLERTPRAAFLRLLFAVGSHPYPRFSFRFALASIFAAVPGAIRPAFTAWVARAFAFAACDLSGMGNLRDPGNPNDDAGSAFRFVALSLATAHHTKVCAAS